LTTKEKVDEITKRLSELGKQQTSLRSSQMKDVHTIDYLEKAQGEVNNIK
jgi:hypothetical protein